MFPVSCFLVSESQTRLPRRAKADWRGPIKKNGGFLANESEPRYVKTPDHLATPVILNYTPHKILYQAVSSRNIYLQIKQYIISTTIHV